MCNIVQKWYKEKFRKVIGINEAIRKEAIRENCMIVQNNMSWSYSGYTEETPQFQ